MTRFASLLLAAALLLAADSELALPEHAALRESVERLLRVNADSFN